jgi:hypothetical protein
MVCDRGQQAEIAPVFRDDFKRAAERHNEVAKVSPGEGWRSGGNGVKRTSLPAPSREPKLHSAPVTFRLSFI